MDRLRDKMDADLKLAGRSESTRHRYIQCASRFVKYFRRPPGRLGAAEVRAFLAYLRDERQISEGAYRPHLAAIKWLYEVTMRRPEVTAGIPWPKARPTRLWTLTRPEVSRILEAAPSAFWRTFFLTSYATGLRRLEVARLRAPDLDARSGLLRVACGKGGKPREVMLDPDLLRALRRHWRDERLPGPWLFPALAPGRKRWQDHPVPLGRASKVFRATVLAADIRHPVTLHGLRHAFATHLLEDGVELVVIQQLLGHAHIETTTRYSEVRTDRIRATPSPLAKLLAG